MNYVFDTLKFTQRLEQVGVAREQAVAHAELARDMILPDVATKADLVALETNIRSELGLLRAEVGTSKRELEGSLREVELRMTVKLGAMIAAAAAVMAAVQKLF